MAPSRKRGRRGWKLAAAGLTLVVGGLGFAIGPGAAWLVDHLGDGQRAWRLGRIEIDNVSGSWLGDLRAQRVVIRDQDGVWLSANDLALDWRPLDIMFGKVRIDAGRAARINILRAPVLTASRGHGGIDVEIGDIDVQRLVLDETVVGGAGEFSLALSLDVRSEKLRQIDLSLTRLDSDADQFALTYHEDYALSLDLRGAPGGVFAHALGVPEQVVAAQASGEGDAHAGATQADASIDGEPVFDGEARWSAADWSVRAAAQLHRLAPLQTLARRIGADVRLAAAGARGGRFSALAQTPFIALDLAGATDANLALDGPASFVATTQRLSDIAREAPFSFGPARLEGELRQERGITGLRATLQADELDALGQRVSFVGPVEAALTPEAFTLSATLNAPAHAPALFANGVLSTQLSYDRARGRFALEQTELNTDAVGVDAQGWANRGDGEFSGEWRARKLGAFVAGLHGQAGGRWRSSAAPDGAQHLWTTAIDGAGADIAGDTALAQVLGPSPRLDALLRNENGGVTVSHARINGANLRVGASGRIVRGEVNLALEASARGPLQVGAMEVVGAMDANGRLSGRISRPALDLRVALSSLAGPAIVVDQPVIDFTLAPTATGYAGYAELNGLVAEQALTASSELALTGNAVGLNNLDATLGRLRMQGAARLAAAGASADLALSGQLDSLAPGVGGHIDGSVRYRDEALLVDARIAEARAGELRIRTATLRAEGPLSGVEARYELVGRLRQAPLSIAGAALITSQDGATDLHISGAGALAGVPVATRTPISARLERGALQATAYLAVGDGAVTAEWRERGRAVSGAAQIQDAPLAPLAAIWGEHASGRIEGAVRFDSAGRGLSGSANLAFNDARFAGRQRGVLNLRIVGELEPTRLTAQVDARSADGLVAHFEADAPVVTSATPLRVALAPERQGRARWSVQGPAESLWAAARLPDQALSGALDGVGELQFGAGHFSGAGHVEIVNGRFEDKLTAVSLIDLNARLAFDERGVSIERFSAAGARGGRLTATGGSANPSQGRIALRVEDMRIVSRPDARATASGELIFSWEGLHSSLSGALDIAGADMDIAANAQEGIAAIDVIEINRPEADWAPDEGPQAPRRNGSTALDVRVRAPGRVFTRGRGVDAEWSLDLRLAGTARAPQLYGEARSVRGTLALSGQPFEIEDGRIFFNGDPLDARIDLTAQRDTADLSARIRLTGTARDPEIAFSSDPALPEDEILPQVLFGRSVEDLSPFEAAQLAASLAALSGRASLDLVDAARAAAGLDRFNLRQDEDGGFLVAGGVYLTRDVYVEVARTGLGQAQSRVEWTVRPRLVLVTSFLGNGDQRVSLRWRRESD